MIASDKGSRVKKIGIRPGVSPGERPDVRAGGTLRSPIPTDTIVVKIAGLDRDREPLRVLQHGYGEAAPCG
jgi:hypothetical protein